MKALAAVALALMMVGTGMIVLGATPTAAAPLQVAASSSSCPPPAPVSSGWGPYGPMDGQSVPTVQPTGPGPLPAATPGALKEGAGTFAEANLTVSAGDLLVITAQAVNFGPGAGNGPNGSGAPVLQVADTLGSFFWIGNLSDSISFGGHTFYKVFSGGTFSSVENLTYETWFGTAGGTGHDLVTVTLTNPAPATSSGAPGYTQPAIIAVAYPQNESAIANEWSDAWGPSLHGYASGGSPLDFNATAPQCVSVLAEAYAVNGFKAGTWGVSDASPWFGRNTNYTPTDVVNNGTWPKSSVLVSGFAGPSPVQSSRASDPAPITWMAWTSFFAASTMNSVESVLLSSAAVEDGAETVSVAPGLTPGGLGETPNGCTSATLNWTNPTPPYGKSLVNDTVYLYTGSGTLIQAISTGGPATGWTVTGLTCGATYWFQVQPWWTGAIPGGLSGALSFIAGQFAGTASAPTAAAFLGLTPVDMAGVAALAVVGTAVVFVGMRGHHRGRSVGGRRRR